MKIKTTQIIKKLMPNSKNFRVRVKNQRKLSEELFTDINSLSYERKEKGCDLMFRL